MKEKIKVQTSFKKLQKSWKEVELNKYLIRVYMSLYQAFFQILKEFQARLKMTSDLTIK